MSDEPFKTVKYRCRHCGMKREITLTQEHKEQIDAYYEQEEAGEIVPGDFPFIEDEHENPDKDIPLHTMHVEFDRRYTKRKDYVVHKLIQTKEGYIEDESGLTRLESTEDEEIEPEEAKYPPYDELCKLNEQLYKKGKKIIKNIDKKLKEKYKQKINKEYDNIDQLMDKEIQKLNKDNDNYKREKKKIEEKYDIKKERIKEKYDKEKRKTIVIKSPKGKKDTEKISYEELKDAYENWKSWYKSDEKIWNNPRGTEKVYFRIHKPEKMLTSKADGWETISGMRIDMYTEQPLDPRIKEDLEGVVGSLLRITQEYSKPGKERPFQIDMNYTKKDAMKIEKKISRELQEAKELNDAARKHNSIKKALESEENEGQTNISVEVMEGKGKRHRKYWKERLRESKKRGMTLTDKNLEDVKTETKYRKECKSGTPYLILGGGAEAGAGISIGVGNYIIDETQALHETYTWYEELGVLSKVPEEVAQGHALYTFATNIMPWISGGLIAAGIGLLGWGIRRWLKRKFNKERYGTEDGWAEHSDKIHIIDTGAKVSKKGEKLITLRSVLPKKPMSELLTWRSRLRYTLPEYKVES